MGRNFRVLAVVATLVIVGAAAPAHADWEAGVAAFKAKDYATAAREFEQVVQTNESFAGGYYMLGLAQRELGKGSQAVANLRKAVELEGSNQQYRLALGQTLVNAEQWSDAYTALKAIDVSGLPANQRSVVSLMLAKAASETGRGAESIAALRAEAQANPRNANLQQALGVAYSKEGDYAKAYDAFKKAYDIGKDEAAGRSAVSSAIQLARRTSGAAKSRYYTEAAQLAEQLAQAKPTFDHNLLAGEAWLGAKQYAKAAEWFEKAAAKQGQNSLVYYYKGQCYTSLSQYDRALGELQQALKLGPTGKLRNQIYNQMGYVYAKQRDFDKAINAYNQAGNTQMVAEVRGMKEAADQNRAADLEQAEYERKMKELEEKMEQLKELGGGG